MASWGEFALAARELAEFGADRFRTAEVAYLATVREDGSPRVHPVTPIVARDRLFVFTGPASPKGHDLRRDGRYAIHSLVTDQNGTGGEFAISGRARPVDDAATRAVAVQAAPYTSEDSYVLFELTVEEALSTVYADAKGLEPVRTRWRERDA